jgi:anti-sigma regulatory factor (Ser/Thr protein kinase)
MPYHRCAACGLTSYNAPAHVAANVCPVCSASLGDAAQVYIAPGATHTINRTLAARLDAGSKARRVVVGLPISKEAREQLALVVSELVNNAVLHTGAADADSLRLKVRLRSGRVRVEVRDNGPGFDPPSQNGHEPHAAGGYGLEIVAAISETWGVVRRRGGCTVWCEVLVEEPAQVAAHEMPGTYARELATAMAATALAGATP